MKAALQAKFSLSESHKTYLIETGNDTLAEASRDSYWGIGLSLRDKQLWSRDKWSGENKLGILLEEVRHELM